jgi:hypothetical protein
MNALNPTTPEPEASPFAPDLDLGPDPTPPPAPHAVAHFDRRTEDLGNIVEFGHVNTRVPDQLLATVFYVTGLGLTRDPYERTGIDNAWINVGTSQFHLPTGQPQVLRGTTVLVVPDLDTLVVRLARIAQRLNGTKFSFSRTSDTQVDVTCPWGNRLRVHAPDAQRFGSMTLGIPCVEIDTAPGTASRIARFYRGMLGALAEQRRDSDGLVARISVGLHESLVFRETPHALPPYDGHHVQVTVVDFSGVHRRLQERGLVTEESDQSQYRFQDIIDLDTGEVLCTLEHEVRSMRHPQYRRLLVNRPWTE